MRIGAHACQVAPNIEHRGSAGAPLFRPPEAINIRPLRGRKAPMLAYLSAHAVEGKERMPEWESLPGSAGCL